MVQSLKAGADATIEKPVNMLELELLIENLINNKNSIRRHYSPKEDIVQSVESIRGLSVALILGICFGTYASIFIGTPVMFDAYMWNEKRKEAKKAATKK